MTRLRGRKEVEVVLDEGRGESEMTWESRMIMGNNNEEEPEREQMEKRIPKMKAGERYEMEHKEARGFGRNLVKIWK